MDRLHLEDLMKSYFQGTLTAEDERELVTLLTEDPSEEILDCFDQYYNRYAVPVEFRPVQKEEVWNQIVNKQLTHPSITSWHRYLSYAAILIGVLMAGFFAYQFLQTEDKSSNQELSKTIYLRDSHMPQLTIKDQLGDVKVIPQDQLENYGLSLVSPNHIAVLKDHFVDDKFRYHTLSLQTHAGQVCQLTLSDGSTVWLNSRSQFTFPQSFHRDQRVVELQGEGYFEVTSQVHRPFEVKTGKVTTHVLGTHFNIAAYPDQMKSITLLEGSVKVLHEHAQVMLSPGQQAYVEQSMEVRNVDLASVIAWQQGYFYFDNLSARQLMDQIKEWYDIKFVKYDYASEDRFSGTFKKSKSLVDLLRHLEEVSSIHFKIKEGGVYVLKK